MILAQTSTFIINASEKQIAWLALYKCWGERSIGNKEMAREMVEQAQENVVVNSGNEGLFSNFRSY